MKYLLIFVLVSLGSIVCFGHKPQQYNVENEALKQRMDDLLRIADDSATKVFELGGATYAYYSREDADFLHMLGTVSDYDCFFEFGHAAVWRYFDKAKVDSISQWLSTINYSISDSALTEYLTIQNDYNEFTDGSPEYNYMQFTAFWDNWPDSIKEEHLRTSLLDSKGRWKRVYDPYDVNWLDLDGDDKLLIDELIRTYPTSRFLRAKLKNDSLTMKYDGLNGLLHKSDRKKRRSQM